MPSDSPAQPGAPDPESLEPPLVEPGPGEGTESPTPQGATPTVPEPVVPEPTVPEPTVPEPTVPEPVVPEPGSPSSVDKPELSKWGAPFRWLRAFISWVWRVATGLLAPPVGAIGRLVQSVVGWVAAVVEWLLERWRRIFASTGHDKGERSRIIGGEGAFLVAAFAVAFFWYWLPTRELFEMSTASFVKWTIATWVLALIGAMSLCRATGSGALNRWTQGLYRRTGLARWEGFAAVATLVVMYLVHWRWHHIESLPLTVSALVGFAVVRSSDELPRPATKTFVTFEPTSNSDEALKPELFSVHEFAWSNDLGETTQDMTLRVIVNLARYSEFREANPERLWVRGVPMVAEWVTKGHSNEVDQVAGQFAALSATKYSSTYFEICMALSFAQHIEYESDEVTVGIDDYWRYAIETIHDEVGDCEDTAILAAAVLRRMGHKVALIEMPGHLALGVQVPGGTKGLYVTHKGTQYYYCETTTEGFRVGERPTGVHESDLRVLPVEAYIDG